MGNISPGDIYMVNDPYEAATHTNDIFLVKPIFFGGDASPSSARRRIGLM